MVSGDRRQVYGYGFGSESKTAVIAKYVTRLSVRLNFAKFWIVMYDQGLGF